MKTIDKNINTWLLIVFIFCIGMVIGYFGGIDRAVKSAYLMNESETEYVIRYDLVGAQVYARD